MYVFDSAIKCTKKKDSAFLKAPFCLPLINQGNRPFPGKFLIRTTHLGHIDMRSRRYFDSFELAIP